MKFTLEITLGNEAMRTGEDIAAELDSISQTVYQLGEKITEGGTGRITDLNGNKVGEWRVTGPAPVVYDDDNWPPPMR